MMKQRRVQTQQMRISPKLRAMVFSSAIFAMAAGALVIYANFGTAENAAAGTGSEGDKTITHANTIVNDFTTLTTDASAGASQIVVSDNTINVKGRFTGDLEPGALIMIVQMQRASQLSPIGETAPDHAGKYEFAEVTGVEEDGKINLTAALKNSYTTAGKTQVVRVPRYSSLTVNPGAVITTDGWNGNTGGIVAIDITGTTSLNGTIDVTGKGFAGGQAAKISRQIIPAYTQFNDTLADRLFMGSGSFAEGINGGGVVYLLCGGTISGTGSIHADGSNMIAAAGSTHLSAGNGGTVMVYSHNSPIREIAITANGGNVQSQLDSTQALLAMKMQTGGKGGRIRTSNASFIKMSVSGGTFEQVMIQDSTLHAAAGSFTTGSISPYSRNIYSLTKLRYFAATPASGVVKVNWVTASEMNNDFFMVERSTDGINYLPVYKTNGKGNSGTNATYTYEDDSRTSGTSFYRLTQTDQTGHTSTYPPAMIRAEASEGGSKLLAIKPNPFTDNFVIHCSVAKPGLVDFKLTDISGNVVRKETAVTGSGNNVIPFENLNEVPKGVYFISMATGEDKYSTIKIVK